ncbi:LamG-like jellyroll fold domain-containing protein [Kitasatospora sp. LaBMicrA B282]|uniref:LamG domain-containing protein n=1 Tax=Kitasatospora sp. LaBMicrA B282 TaxID=3420949 RepID=UPI003D135172
MTAPTGDAEDSRADLDVYHWPDDPRQLAFPREIARVGYAELGADRLPRVRVGGKAERGPGDVFPDDEVDPFLSSTARLTAAEPFQAVSDGRHLFVFRQSVAAGHADSLAYTSTGALTGGKGAKGKAVAPSALLCDRFVLAGSELKPVQEVRYRRSRHRTRPESVKDSLGITDMDDNPFYEPTLHLGFAGPVTDGRFTVLLLPTAVAGTSRWQFFVHNAASECIEAINVEQGEDGLFHTRGSRLYTSPDPQYRGSVLERKPGTCPFSKQPLVPQEPDTRFAESALRLTGSKGKGYGEAEAPDKLGTAAYTVEAWARPDKAGGTVLSTGEKGIALSVTDKGALVLTHGTAKLNTKDKAVPTGAHIHVAAVYDGKTATLLVNGATAATGELAAAGGGGGKLLLGASGASAGQFSGELDEVRLWSRARRIQRVAETMGERLVGDEPELTAYYRLDEGTGTSAYDSGSRAAHAALKGTTAWVTSGAPVADHPGIRRDAFRVTGRTVSGGLSVALYQQQEEGLAGHGTIRPLKRQTRVLLTWTAGTAADQTGRIAALDLAVARDGRLAQLPDALDLPVVGTAVEEVDPARENQLKAEVEEAKKKLEKATKALADLEADITTASQVESALRSALAKAAAAAVEASGAGGPDSPVHCTVYVYELKDGLRHLTYRPKVPLPDGAPSNLREAEGLPEPGDDSAKWSFKDKGLKNAWDSSTHKPNSGFEVRQEGDGTYLHSPKPAAPPKGTVSQEFMNLGSDVSVYLVLASPSGDAQIEAVAAVKAAFERHRAVLAPEAARAARNEEITGLTTSLQAKEEELGRISGGTKGRSDRTLPMVQLGHDRLGLGWSGALLDFAATNGSPFLAAGGTGHLGLYYRDEQDRLTGLSYDTNVDRSTKKLTASDGTTVLLTARDAGIDLADVTVEVTAHASVTGRCTLTLTTKAGDKETWTLLPRAAEGLAAALNGQRSAPVHIATTDSAKDGVLTLKDPGTSRALAAGSLLELDGRAYALAEAVDAKATELSTTHASDDPAIPAETAVRLISYHPGLVTHTRPGAGAEFGSRYVTASVISTTAATTGSVADGTATDETGPRPPRWWGDLPGRALKFSATTTPPALPAASLAAARITDDLTIEAWLKPEQGDSAEDTRRIVHVNTGSADADSQFTLALGATTDKKPDSERQLIAGVGNRFVTSLATVPADRWTHVAAAFEQSWALRFANGARVEVPHAEDLNIGGDLTLEVFLRTDKLDPSQGVLSKGRIDDGRGHRVPYQLGITKDGKLVFTFEDHDGKPVKKTSTDKVTKGTFHRIAVVRKLGDTREEKKGTRDLSLLDAAGLPVTVDVIESLTVRRWSDITFYIDGQEAGNDRHDDAPDLGHPGPLEIGRTRSGASVESFDGVISEVRVWNVARQKKDIGADIPFAAAQGRARGAGETGEVDARSRPQGLVAHWRFEENEGNRAKDECGRHTGRLNGARWTKNPDPNGSRFRLYVDGLATLATPLPAAEAPAEGAYGPVQFALGGRTEDKGTTDRWLGVLEEVRIWRTARGEEQILDSLFGRLIADSVDLLAHYPFDDESTDAEATQVVDHGPRELHLPLADDEATRPQPLMSTAPISCETPEVRPVFATGQPRFVQAIAATPAVSEYADLQRQQDRSTRGVLKRCYAYVQDKSWHLVTGYKLGDLKTEWVGQVQFDPQLIGYVEGAPPIPSENLIATRRVTSLSYINATSVEFQQADQVVQTLSSGGEKTADSSLALKFSQSSDSDTLAVIAPLGFGTASPVAEIDLDSYLGTTLEFSNGWGDQTDVSESLETARSTMVGLSGGWESDDPQHQIDKDGGRRFLPSNTGYALVQSETADVFALRVAHPGAVVAYRMLPNPDIPRDWNLLPFAINPRYVKQGTLDGTVGFTTTSKLLDPHYPNASDYGEYSYYKPSEAYALKRRITEDQQRRQAYYASVSTRPIDPDPAQERARELLSRFTGPIPGPGTAAGKGDKRKEADGYSRRDIANTYVWSADGGFFAETTGTTDVVTETTTGSYRFNGMAQVGLSAGFEIFGVGLGFQMDAAFGGGFSRTRTRSKESTRSFNLNVSVDTPGDMQKYDDDFKPLFNGKEPVEVPGRVDAYRFMTFYLDSDKANFEDFYGKVVDHEWLESANPNAAALRQARQAEHKPPCWRVLHRVTFVSRKLPPIVPQDAAPVEKAMRTVDISSNYELVRRLEPFVDPAVTNRKELLDQVSTAVDRLFPELTTHAEAVTDVFAAYHGIA